MRHNIKMELQQKRQMVRNFDARIHRKTTLQIQSSNAKTTTTCTIPMRTQDVWKIGATPNRNLQFTASRTIRNYPRPKSRRKHPIICTLGRQYPPCRTKHPCKRTGTRDREKNRKHETHDRLLSDESKRNSKILPIRHDLKCALRCILSLSKKRQESCSWPFLPRLATRRQMTHPPERANPNALHNPQVRRSIHGGSRIRRNVFKRKRSENNQTHTRRARPPATTYPHALR